MFKAVIFDYFGTLSSEVAPTWLKGHFSPDQMVELRRQYITHVDKGDMDEREMFDALSGVTGIAPDQIRNEWLQIAALHPDMLDLAKSLKGRYKIAILSDTASAFFRDVLKANGISDLFDVIVVSSEIHVTKADDGSYAKALALLGVGANEAVMIDDIPANIEHAKKLGITGFVFSGYGKLKEDLASIGVAV